MNAVKSIEKAIAGKTTRIVKDISNIKEKPVHFALGQKKRCPEGETPPTEGSSLKV